MKVRWTSLLVILLAILCFLAYWARTNSEKKALRDELTSLGIPVVKRPREISKTVRGEEVWYNVLLWRSATYTELAQKYKGEMLKRGWHWQDEASARAIDSPRPPILHPIRMEKDDYATMVTFNPPIGDPDEKGIDEIIIILTQKNAKED